ncbi:hypothetical protein RCL2_001666500 [Rhizophagus clarus]|uniref:Uncharacterized protein n=1 Tax=Rhizophagus clarus TaxID=94130 RepID=A0A8H3LJL8_9GLOM|nr:hypothetical protein RCL2_001666500 [Rhizophagus clarus]
MMKGEIKDEGKLVFRTNQIRPNPLPDSISDRFQTPLDAISDHFRTPLDAISDRFWTPLDAISDRFRTPLNAILVCFQTRLDAISDRFQTFFRCYFRFVLISQKRTFKLFKRGFAI